MDYLNLTLRVVRSPEYIGADVAARGTWLSVAAYCADQENGGRIKGAVDWDDRSWMLACGVTANDVAQSAPLLSSVDGDIVAMYYPVEQESIHIAKREGGRKAARLRAGIKEDSCQQLGKTPVRTPAGELSGLLPDTLQDSSDVREGKGKEGKSKGSGSLSFRVELFKTCHPACSACNTMAVENLIREYTVEQFQEALKAFSTQWAGADFPPSCPPLKEFSKYLQRSARFQKKNGAPSTEPPAPQVSGEAM